MTSNVLFEKNKMASTLAASVSLHGLFTKCKEAERRVKFKGNRKRCREENEKNVTNFPWETTSGKVVLQISYNNKAS